jgi:transposase
MWIGPTLSDPSSLRCQYLGITPDRITIRLIATAPAASCPACACSSTRIHSRYTRTLADLPWQGITVTLQLRVRRFACENPDCSRRIFCERLPNITDAHARKTRRLAEALRHLGFECGGEGGSRLAATLGMPASADTILDLVRHAPISADSTPHVLGVDDWAWHKGQRYGTILCDLETHRRVDLLPERSAESFSAWLMAHPGVQIVSRDRGGCYARGAASGAPQAMQVADRFHLIHNLHDALKRTLDRHHSDLREAAKIAASSLPTEPTPVAPPPSAAPAGPVIQEPAPSRRLELYTRVRELHEQGRSQRQIAKQLGIDRETVSRFVNADEFPRRATRTRIKPIDRHADYLAQRWREGCHNARILTRQLKSQGFTGSYHTVRRFVSQWQAAKGDPQANPTRPTRAIRRPSARAVAWMLLKDPGQRKPEDQRFLEILWQRRPELKLAGDLALEFRHMLHDRNLEALEGWLGRTHEPIVPSGLTGFADGLKHDYEAVKAAFIMTWSNGQVEGQVNRLKLIKRQMYGRAGFDLLRQRVLHTG